MEKVSVKQNKYIYEGRGRSSKIKVGLFLKRGIRREVLK